MNKKDILRIAFFLAVVIIWTFLFSFVAFASIKNEIKPVQEIWNLGNTQHYVNIAKGTSAGGNESLFFLYPVLIRFLFFLFRDYMWSALAISNLAYCIAAFYLFKIVRLDYDGKVAFRSVFYLSIFPTAYFLHAGYPESLFLAFAIPSFYYARKARWLASVALAFFASLANIAGLLLISALIIEYLCQKPHFTKKSRTKFFLLALILLIFLFSLINYFAVDHNLNLAGTQNISSNTSSTQATFFWNGLAAEWHKNLSALQQITFGIQIVSIILGLFFTIYSIFKQHTSYAAYMVVMLAFAVTSSWESIPRFMLLLFPIFITISNFAEREELNFVLALSSIFLQSVFFILFIVNGWTL